MQKKLIALAIAGLASTGAMAQTNVTIYGVLDLAYGNVKSDQTAAGISDAKFSGILNGVLSGSRLGFRVNEDLGNGWSAQGLLELGTIQADGGNVAGGGSISGAGNTRQSYVGLSNAKFGTFQMGRIYTAGTNTAGKFDPEAASLYGPVNRMTTGLGLSIDGAGGNNARVNNSIAWLSPNWSGFTAQVQYAFGENGEQTAAAATGNGGDDARMWGLGLDYTNGPLAVGFAYNDWSDYGGTPGTVGAVSRDMKEWFVGASYDFGMVKVLGSYQDFDMDNMTGAGAQVTTGAAGCGVSLVTGAVTACTGAAFAGAGSNGDIWSIGAVVPVFKVGAVTLSYASLDRTVKAAAVGNAKSNQDADGWSISYKHNLSKRTTAHIGYTKLSNDGVGTLGLAPAGAGLAAPSAGQDSRGYAMGVRHTF